MSVIAKHNSSHGADSRWLTSAEDSPPRSLPDAIGRVIRSYGDVGMLAMVTGFSRASLYHWSADPENDSGAHRGSMPASAIEGLTKATGNRAIVSYLAAAVGCVLIALPDPDDATEPVRPCVERLATVLHEVADMQRAFADRVLIDGHVSHEDAAVFRHEAVEAIQAIHQAVLEVDRAAEQGEPTRKPPVRANGKGGR